MLLPPTPLRCWTRKIRIPTLLPKTLGWPRKKRDPKQLRLAKSSGYVFGIFSQARFWPAVVRSTSTDFRLPKSASLASLASLSLSGRPAASDRARFTHGEPTQYHRSLRTSKAMADFVLALDRDPMLQAGRWGRGG